MQRTEPPLIIVAMFLAALAGFVDALAFTSLGGFFAAFMSGNSTRLGVGFGSGDAYAAKMAGGLILSFVSGVIGASVVARATGARARGAVMAAVTLLLFAGSVVAVVMPGPAVLLLLACAMGAMNGVFTRDGDASAGLTYMIGSLVRVGQGLGGALMGDADRWGWVPHLTLWIGFVAGAVSGAASQWRWGWNALWLAALLAAAITVVLVRLGRPRVTPVQD